MAETQLVILRTMRARNKSAPTTEWLFLSLSPSLSKVWSMDQRSNALDLLSYSVGSIPRSRINTEIIEQSWFAPILPQWRCFMSSWCTHRYASMVSPLFRRKAPRATLRYITLHYVVQRGRMHFLLNNRRTSSSSSPWSKSFNPLTRRGVETRKPSVPLSLCPVMSRMFPARLNFQFSRTTSVRCKIFSDIFVFLY